MPTKVYSYGVYRLTPDVEKSLADMMYAAHRYYNLLVELENRRRANLEAIRVAMSADVAAAQVLADQRQADLDAAIKACQDYKARSRETVASEPLRAAVTTARAELRKAWEARRLACKALHATAEWKAAQKAEQDAHHARQKAAYNGSSVWWGTKLAVGEDVERAAHDTKFGPVRFRRWTRNGRLSAQIQKGMSSEDVMAGEDARVRMARVPGKKKRAWCHLRLASDEKKKPVFTVLPVAMHRDLPAGGTVKWVHLVRRQGWHYYPGRDQPPVPRDKWYVQFVVVTPDEPVADKSGMAAIDVGWRLRPDGSLRVAYWVDDRGREGELTLPPDLLALWDRRNEAQAERDLLFNNTRDRLADWIDANRESLTDEFLEATQTIRHWRGYNRLHILLMRWNELQPGVAGQDDTIARPMYAELLEWQREDVRLETVFVTSGRKSEWRRKWLYQNFAASMGQAYGTIGIENLNVADMRKDEPPEAEQASQVQVGYRNAASVGLLLECVVANGRAKVMRLDCRRTTTDCHRCGSAEDVDRSKLYHTCLGCGTEWDQDANAAYNLLSRMQRVDTDGGERPGDGGSGGPARPTDGHSGQAVMPEKVVKKIPKRRRKPTLSQNNPQSSNSAVVA